MSSENVTRDRGPALQALADRLVDEGYDVSLASSVSEALSLLSAERVDAIMLASRVSRAAGGTSGSPMPVRFDQERRRMLDELRRKEVEAAEARLAHQLAEARARYLADVEAKNVELERARAEAEEASRVKSEFLASMSHEIRTPMNAILGFTELLLDDEDDEANRQRLRVIREAGRNLLALINDVLDVSKIEAGKLRLATRPFSVRALVRQVSELFRFSAREKALGFEIQIDPTLPDRLVGDDHRLNQVLTNLLGNAFKFTSAGKITLALSRRDGGTIFRVSDTGVGIPRDKQARLFQPFEQADRSTTRQYGGTGLGLAICKNLVELMGGTVTLDSEPGRGSTFTVHVPLPVAADQAPAPHSREARAVAADGEAMVQRWLEAQPIPELRDLVLENLAERLTGELDRLEEAVHTGTRADIHAMAHAIKGWSGSYQMTELFVPIARLDALAGRDGDLDRAGVAALHAEVRVVLSRIPARYLRPGTAATPPVAAAPSSGELRVLVVDDNEMNRLLLKTLLDKMRVAHDLAENGARALEMMGERAYDLVLLDMEMPVLDGWQTIQRVRQDPRLAGLEVIALTAHAVTGSAERCLDAGCDAFLTKPLDLAELRRVVEERRGRSAAA